MLPPPKVLISALFIYVKGEVLMEGSSVPFKLHEDLIALSEQEDLGNLSHLGRNILISRRRFCFPLH